MNHLLLTHSVLRWAVLLFGLYAITKAALGLIKDQDYTQSHNISRLLFLISMHLQIVIGLMLYFTLSKYANIDMGDGPSRFWGVEHIFGMVLAAVLITIGSSKTKKATEAKRKHQLSFRFFLVGFIIILATIPWPLSCLW